MGREGEGEEEGAEAHLYEYEFWRQHISTCGCCSDPFAK